MVVRWAPIDEIGRGWEYGLLGGAKAWMPRFNPFGFFAIFALGALAGGIQVALSNIRHWLLDVLGLSALLATVFSMALLMGGETEGYGWLGIPYAFPWLPLFVGAALVALPSSMVVGRLLDNPVSRFVAAISFGIYVWHFLLIELLADLVPPVFDTSGDAVWAVWLWSSAAAMGLSFILATASFYFLERPVVRWARTLEGRQKSLEAAPASA
jgi:peptidoglycan/LPS O-acetylase OafA/YrhL